MIAFLSVNSIGEERTSALNPTSPDRKKIHYGTQGLQGNLTLSNHSRLENRLHVHMGLLIAIRQVVEPTRPVRVCVSSVTDKEDEQSGIFTTIPTRSSTATGTVLACRIHIATLDTSQAVPTASSPGME